MKECWSLITKVWGSKSPLGRLSLPLTLCYNPQKLVLSMYVKDLSFVKLNPFLEYRTIFTEKPLIIAPVCIVTYLTNLEIRDVHFLMTRADLFSSSCALDRVRPSSMWPSSITMAWSNQQPQNPYNLARIETIFFRTCRTQSS